MLIDRPIVSVILTSFNHGRFIREAIESVLSQTFIDFELIIWDDASTDNSWEIIEATPIHAFGRLETAKMRGLLWCKQGNI